MWLQLIIAVVLTYPVVLLAGLLVGTIIGSRPIFWLSARIYPAYPKHGQDIIASVLTVPPLLLGIYFLYNGIHLWASSSLLLFSCLLIWVIPLLKGAEWFRNLQFIIGLLSALYFCHMLLGHFLS